MVEIPSTTNSTNADISTGEQKTLQQDAVARLAAARQWKNFIELDVKEAIF